MLEGLGKIPLMYRYAMLAFTVVAASGIFTYGGGVVPAATHYVFAVAAAMAIDLAANYAKNRKLALPYSAFITGTIISILLEPGTGAVALLAVAFLAIASKHVLRWNDRHVFNPASFGVALGSLFLPFTATWHGASVLPVVAAAGLFAMHSAGKLETGISALASFALLAAVAALLSNSNPITAVTGIALTGQVVFFSFFMVIEPKTSPFMGKAQVAFGCLAALFSFTALYAAPLLFPLGGLLFANVFTKALDKAAMAKA